MSDSLDGLNNNTFDNLYINDEGTAPTQVSTDNSNKIATTAFVKTLVSSIPSGPSGQGFNWKGAYSDANHYYPYDVCIYTDGSAILCITEKLPNTGNEASYFSLFVQSITGATGATGATGPQGPAGSDVTTQVIDYGLTAVDLITLMLNYLGISFTQTLGLFTHSGATALDNAVNTADTAQSAANNAQNGVDNLNSKVPYFSATATKEVCSANLTVNNGIYDVCTIDTGGNISISQTMSSNSVSTNTVSASTSISTTTTNTSFIESNNSNGIFIGLNSNSEICIGGTANMSIPNVIRIGGAFDQVYINGIEINDLIYNMIQLYVK